MDARGAGGLRADRVNQVPKVESDLKCLKLGRAEMPEVDMN